MENDKIKVVCIICNNEFEVTKSTYQRKKYKNIKEWKCKKCIANESKIKYDNLPLEEKQRRAKISSNKMKSYWKSLDKNEKDRRLNLLNEGFEIYNKSLSDNDKDILRKQKSESMKKMWDNMDHKRKLEILKPMREGFINWYNSLSDEEKKNHHKYIQDGNNKWWNNLNEEDKKIYSDIRSKSSKEYWDNITDEDRKLVSKRQSEQIKQYWDNMTKSQYEEWDRKRSDGFNKYMNNLSILLNKNEISLINYLNIYKFKYQSHYYNKIKHPDFDKLFPFNLVTGSKFVSPFHQWDIAISTYDGIILIDIDGSIHDIKNINHEITYFNGNKIKLSDIISFNDSQRPYQTDGLPAYVIQCYDDNLNMNTPVININTNENIIFNDLLNLISWMDMDINEKYKIISEVI